MAALGKAEGLSELSNLDTTEESRDRAEGHDGALPRVAISALKRGEDPGDVGRIPLHYVHAVRAAGGIPEILSAYELHPDEVPPEGLTIRTSVDPDDRSLLDGVAGLILSGGGDVDPALYGQEPHPRISNVNPLRDRLESTLADVAIQRDLPFLAICRGMQLLNVYLGGTLEQHLADVPDRLPHDRDRPRVEAVHRVKLKEDSLLSQCLGSAETGVNSHHHQALDRVAAPLREIGWAEDGVLEAVESTEHSWIVGVQWHPEVMAPVHHDQAHIFACFVRAARRFETAVPISA
jgi:putative glutamine amidotransferase